MPRLLLLLLFFFVADAADFTSRSPENCYCETWSVGNALGALGGIDGDYDVAPGRTYSGGRSQTSSGSSDGERPCSRVPLKCQPATNVGNSSDWRLALDAQYISTALPLAASHPANAFIQDALVDPQQCRSPALSRAGSAGHWQRGPWCFVEGDGADTASPSAAPAQLHDGDGVGSCPGLRRETCGVKPCDPPRPACVEFRAGAGANAPLLLGNGGFERVQPLGPATARLSRERQLFGLDVVPLNWFFCGVSAGSDVDSARADTYTYCSTYASVLENAQPADRPWRVLAANGSAAAAANGSAAAAANGSAAAAAVPAPSGALNDTRGAVQLRVGGAGAFNRTSVRTQLGATASLAEGATYRLSVWVRCGSPAAFPADNASALALDASVVVTARVEALPPLATFQYSKSATSPNGLPLYQAVPVAAGSSPASAALLAPCNASEAAAGEQWREVSVTFTAASTVRDTSVVLRAQSDAVAAPAAAAAPGGALPLPPPPPYSGWVTFDNVTLTRVTPAPDAAAICDAGVEGGTPSWTCNHVAANFFNVLREQRGVPFSTPQFSYLLNGPLNDAIAFVPFEANESVRIGGYAGPSPCASMVGARVPGLTEESVNAAMAAVSDAELAAGLGWDAASAADGGFAEADVPGALSALRAEIYQTVKAGVLRPFSGPAAGGAPWQPGNAVVRFPDRPSRLLERLVNVYLSKPYRQAGDAPKTCELDRETWSPTLCYIHAWFANVYASNRAFRGAELPVNANGEHFSVAWYGKRSLFSPEQTSADANWYWMASRLSPQTFGGLVGGGLAALGSPALGNMTMRGLLPCADHFNKVVQEISMLPYPCNTMQGFNEPFAAAAYIKLILDSHANNVGGLCVNTLDYVEGQTLAAEVLAAAAEAAANATVKDNVTAPVDEDDGKDGTEPWVIPVAVGGGVAFFAAIAVFVWHRRRRASTESDAGDNASSLRSLSGTSTSTNASTIMETLVVVEFDQNGKSGGRKGNNKSSLISHSKMQLVECIAQGGEGIVYLGKFANNLVAVKLLNSLKDAEHEINIFEQLPKHPNLVNLLGYTNFNSRWSLVMEYCNYRCLHHCLQSGVFFDVADEDDGGEGDGEGAGAKKGELVVKVLQDTLKGLSAIHGANTFHNDIKMENVMISCADPSHQAQVHCDCLRRGRLDNICVKISDLGMSKTHDYAPYSSGNLEGTMCYIPADRTAIPEAVAALSEVYERDRGMSPAEAKKKSYEAVYVLCDIYAFSMLAWELMTSVRRGEEVRVTYSGQVCQDSPLAMFGGKRPDVGEEHGFHPTLAGALERWWAVDITQRTPSAAQVRRELGEEVPHVLDMVRRATPAKKASES